MMNVINNCMSMHTAQMDFCNYIFFLIKAENLSYMALLPVLNG